MWVANLGDRSDLMWTFKSSIERSEHGIGHGQTYYASDELVDII